MSIFGKPGKAGGTRRDTPAHGPVRGRTVVNRVQAASVIVHDAEPFGTAMVRSLVAAFLPMSPMNNGGPGGFLSQMTGAGIVGRESRRVGPIQDWRQIIDPAANPAKANVGFQGGPSAQPAYPSTGSNAMPSIMNQLAANPMR